MNFNYFLLVLNIIAIFKISKIFLKKYKIKNFEKMKKIIK